MRRATPLVAHTDCSRPTAAINERYTRRSFSAETKVSALTPGWGKARWGALGGPTGVGMGREGATPWARRSADRYNVKRI